MNISQDIKWQAETVTDQFSQIFTRYGSIHKAINRKSKLDDQDIEQLG